jgi:hypothetical protein
MSDLKPDGFEQRLDIALGRLPHWEPPADFAPRLAAAAARQALQPAVSPALLQAGNLLQRLSDSALMVLAALSVAGLLVWAVPWAGLVDSADVLVWASAIALSVTGLWMTRRVLVSP